MAEHDGDTDRLAAVRANIQRYRKQRGMSQADLANRLSAEGFAFFPQTIQKIENGSRTIRLDEAMAIAFELDCDLELLVLDTEVLNEFDAVTIGLARTDEARAEVSKAVGRWMKELAVLREAAGILEASDPAELERTTAEYRENLLRDAREASDLQWEDVLREAAREIERELHQVKLSVDDKPSGPESDDGVDQ